MIKKIKIFQDEIILNSAQKKFCSSILNENLRLNEKNNYRQFAFFGGIRSGKSFLCQLVTWLLCATYRKINVLYIRKYYHELEDSVIKQFRDDFEKYGQFTYVKTKREAHFCNGSLVKFRALDQDGTVVLSSEYDLIVFCQAEEIAQDIYLTAMGRLSGRGMEKAILICEGNPASTWVKKVFKDSSTQEKEEKKIFFCEVPTSENLKNLPEDYIDDLKKNYPDFWIRRFLYGEWENLDEMVFSEFREKEHVIDVVNPEFLKLYKCRQGLDYGWINPTAIVWGYVDYDDNLVIFDEWGASHKTPDEIFQQAIRYGKMVCVADYSIKRPDRDGRSVWDDLSRAGLRLLESNKQELENILLANTLLKKKRIKISRNCVNLLSEIKNYKWKKLKLGEEKNLPEKTVDKDNHFIDALLYLIASLEELHTQSIKEKEYKRSIDYHVRYSEKIGNDNSKGLG